MHSILRNVLLFSTFFLAATVTGNLYDSSSQICCSGKVFNTTKPQLSTAGASRGNFQCCGAQYVQIQTGQICCDNVVIAYASGITTPSCCGNQVYDSSKSQCCNKTIVAKIGTGYSSCCGSQIYNSSSQVCCYQTGKVLDKPALSCPSSVYFSCCGDRLIGPNQQCCNGVPVNPSTTLVKYSYGDYERTSSCCSNGGIVQDSTKESCCNDGSVVPIVGQNSACCGGLFYNASIQVCCGNKIFSNANYGFGCCGDSVYDYSTQTCCSEKVINKINGNSGCCGTSGTTYDYNTQQCCNSQIYKQTTPSLSCCYSSNN